MAHYEKFDEVIAKLQKDRRSIHLLVGNGFSMAYDPKIFSYNALSDFVESIKDPTLSALFSVLKTKNFELIMEQLGTFSALLKELKADLALQKSVNDAHEKLKTSLLDAIKGLHPEHVFKIPQECIEACTEFLRIFLNSGGHLFSTNYDLLLYWVLMRGGLRETQEACDGFGRELLNPVEVGQRTEEAEYSGLVWGPNMKLQRVHYLHGALPLFDAGRDIEKEQFTDEGYLLENIGARLDDKEYPIFVTAGGADEKLEMIRHNQYLSHCYDRLCEINGSIVTFGFGFGQYDDHIIDALNKAAHAEHKNPPKLWSVYIGVYSEADKIYIDSIAHKFHAKVNTFDVKSRNPWH